MPVKIIVRKPAIPKPPVDKVTIEMDIRKDLDDNLIICDPEDYDVLIDVKQGEIYTFLKPDCQDTDLSYQSQREFITFLIKRGLVDRKTVEGGEEFISLKCSYFKKLNNGNSSLKLLLYVIDGYMKKLRRDEAEVYDRIKSKILNIMNNNTLDPADFSANDIMSHRGRGPTVAGSYSPIVDFYTYYS